MPSTTVVRTIPVNNTVNIELLLIPSLFVVNGQVGIRNNQRREKRGAPELQLRSPLEGDVGAR